MKSLKYFIVVTAAIVLSGCCPKFSIRQSGDVHPWTHLNAANKARNFQFAIAADRTGKNRPGVFAEAVDKLNLLKPEFVLSIGDFIEGKTEDNAELDRQWDEFDEMVTKLEMPFFYVPGNHDISNEVMAEKWGQRLGPSYYHFVYRNVLFLCLNTEDTSKRNISDLQLDYFRDALENNSHVRWTLVFMHEPVWRAPVLDNWRKLEELLGDRAYTVFGGHVHTYSKSLRKGRAYYTLSVTGAGGGGPASAPAGVEKGQFDHIVWVTMTDQGPAMANLLLEGILSDDPSRR